MISYLVVSVCVPVVDVVIVSCDDFGPSCLFLDSLKEERFKQFVAEWDRLPADLKSFLSRTIEERNPKFPSQAVTFDPLLFRRECLKNDSYPMLE